jgi:hypothetical protein
MDKCLNQCNQNHESQYHSVFLERIKQLWGKQLMKNLINMRQGTSANASTSSSPEIWLKNELQLLPPSDGHVAKDYQLWLTDKLDLLFNNESDIANSPNEIEKFRETVILAAIALEINITIFELIHDRFEGTTDQDIDTISHTFEAAIKKLSGLGHEERRCLLGVTYGAIAWEIFDITHQITQKVHKTLEEIATNV